MEINLSALATNLIGDFSEDLDGANDSTIDSKFKELLNDSKEAEAEFEQMTKGGIKGFWAWKIDELKKKIAAKVMGALGVTAEKLAAMSDKDRVALETKILKAVEEQLRLAIDEEMKRQQKQQMAATGSMYSLLQAAQGA